MSMQRKEHPCVKHVLTLACGCAEVDWVCDHSDDIEHDQDNVDVKPDYDEEEFCGNMDCPNYQLMMFTEKPVRKKGTKRLREHTPERNPIERLEDIEDEFKIPRGGSWEDRKWERPMPVQNPYESGPEGEQRARDELRIMQEREEDQQRFLEAKDNALEWNLCLDDAEEMGMLPPDGPIQTVNLAARPKKSIRTRQTAES